MYQTLRRNYCWPALPVKVYQVVRNLYDFAKERLRSRKRSAVLKLFPAAAPLDDVAMSLLGKLIETGRGNKHLLVITDRFNKLVRVIPLRTMRAIDIARVSTRLSVCLQRADKYPHRKWSAIHGLVFA